MSSADRQDTAGERARVSAIVLAGGRSSRFGADKLAADLRGEPLLCHVLRVAAALGDEIVLAIDATGPVPDLPPGSGRPVVVVRDEVAGEGPLRAVGGALAAASAPIAIVLAGDAPLVPVGVGRLLLDALGPAAAAVLTEGGRARPVPMALRTEPARRAAADLLAAGERRLRALPEALGPIVIPESTWRALDSAGDALRDVDTPEDLAEIT